MITKGLGGYNIIMGGYAGDVGEIIAIYYEIIRLSSAVNRIIELRSNINGND